ncbi:uncharacterized protein LOC110845491 isoform X2 [Folsomia candida]|uniref:uncharacterized protein LOC110845491 isoform X2 n=1 Tax=Folsomia candida TaxID=158441 RepID=UPI0016054A05|nr:uncharacterized protein LOC110845491 isoform X2 [Folsomia candida]
MECAHCKILILPKLHFYQCKNCSRYYHRSGCVQPVFHANFCQLKRTGWICNTCQYRDLKDINHSPFLTSTQVNQDNIAQATPDNANIVTPITTSKNFRIRHLDLYRYMGCVHCTKSMRIATSEGKFICTTCKRETGRKICFVARQIVLQHVSSECEDITVVAYNNEIVKLLGGHEACSFQSDEDARVEAAKRLIGAIISLKLENYNLSPEKCKIRGAREELVARNIKVICYPNDEDKNYLIESPISLSESFKELHVNNGGCPRRVTENEESNLINENRPKKLAVRSADRKHNALETLNLSGTMSITALEDKYTTILPGLALVINNQNYPRRPLRQQKRVGSEKDVESVLSLLKFLKFKLFRPTIANRTVSGVVIDPSLEEIRKVILQFKAALDQNNASSCMVIFMGHGACGSLTLTNENSISLWTDLVYQFSDKNFTRFSGKPKIFFVEACQSFQGSQERSDEAHSRSLSRDTISDTLVVVSSVPGKYSFLYPTLGSIFIRSLCSSMRRWVQRLMAMEVIHAQNERGQDPYTQMLDYKDLMFKRFYFNI